MNCLPWLGKVKYQSANAVAMRGEIYHEIARGTRVKQDTLRLFPAGVRGFLAKIGVKLVKVGSREFWFAEGTLFQRRGVEFSVQNDGPGRPAQTDVSFHARDKSFSLAIER